MTADPETVLFLLACLGICGGVIWQMHEAHREEVAKLERLIEVEREVPQLVAKWLVEGRPDYVEAGREEVAARIVLRMGLSEGLRGSSNAGNGSGV